MAKIRDVKKNIRFLRRELETLVDRMGVSSTETIHCSRQLDQVINEFYRAKQAKVSSRGDCAAD